MREATAAALLTYRQHHDSFLACAQRGMAQVGMAGRQQSLGVQGGCAQVLSSRPHACGCRGGQAGHHGCLHVLDVSVCKLVLEVSVCTMARSGCVSVHHGTFWMFWCAPWLAARSARSGCVCVQTRAIPGMYHWQIRFRAYLAGSWVVR